MTLHESGERLPEAHESPQRKERRQNCETVQTLRAKHPLKYLLHSAGIPKSSFYDHTGKADPDAAAKTEVAEVYHRHKGRYGHRRIAAVLSWGKNKARRMMKLLGLKAKVRSKKTYRPQTMGGISENILNREFTADKPADKWLTDVTEFKCTDGKLYLSPIPDVFNREIVAYSLGRRANSEMVEQMLNQAFGRLKGQTPLLHSDQGVLYRTGAYRECFFGTLKEESFYREGMLSVAELTGVIDDYIHYYNHERISLNLKKLSPVAYRTQLEQAV